MVPTHEMCERNRAGCNRGPSRAIKVRKLALDRSLTNRRAAPRQSNSTTYLAIVTNVSPPNRFAFTGRRASLTVCLNSAREIPRRRMCYASDRANERRMARRRTRSFASSAFEKRLSSNLFDLTTKIKYRTIVELLTHNITRFFPSIRVVSQREISVGKNLYFNFNLYFILLLFLY